MDDDILDDATQKVIGQMIRASRTLPEDFFLVPAMQELAGFVGRSTLSDEDRSLLIGVGAVIIRESTAVSAPTVRQWQSPTPKEG